MGRRDRNRRTPIARLDLSDLETHDTLLEDLLHYAGPPKVFIPQVWDVCVRVLRHENRTILTELDNKEVLDQVYEDFYNDFSDTKFERIISEVGISVRRGSYRENLAQFLYDVFSVLYPQVSNVVDRLVRRSDSGELLNYTAKVSRTHYDYYNEGFGEVRRVSGVDVEIKTENMLSNLTLRGEGYER